MENISKKDLLILLFKGYGGIYLIISLIGIFSTLIGVLPVHFNGKEYTGLVGMIVIIFFSSLSVISFTFLNWLFLTIGMQVVDYMDRILKKLR